MTTATLPAWCDPTLSREERIAAVGVYPPKATDLIGFTGFCPICKGRHRGATSHFDRYHLPMIVGGCERCDSAWNANRPTADWYANFYASGTYRKLVSAYHGRDVMLTIRKEQEKYAMRLLPHISIYLPCPRSILDIGSSTGAVSRYWYDCERGAVDITLVDPAASEMEFGGKCSTYCEPFETADLSGDKYDIVLLCQTIDHLLEPRACLEKIHRLLASDGLFFVDILDTEQEVAEKGWQQTLKIDHPTYFTDKSARLLLDATGFEIVDSWESAKNHLAYLCKGRAI